MPATEQTWRDQKLMHVIFAVTGLLMLGSTIWMFAADHQREWKDSQRTARRVEKRLNKWQQFQFETDAAQIEQARLTDQLVNAQLVVPDRELLTQFQHEILTTRDDFDFDRIENTYDKLQQRVAAAAEARAAVAAAGQIKSDVSESDNSGGDNSDGVNTNGDGANLAQLRATAESAVPAAVSTRAEFIGDLQALVDHAKSREKEFLRLRKFQAADFDAAKANLGLGHRDGRPPAVLEQLQAKVTENAAVLADKTDIYQNANLHRMRLVELLQQMTGDETESQQALIQSIADLTRLQATVNENSSTYFRRGFPPLGSKWLELPILDAFNPPLKIDNLHLPNLKVDYNFSRVARYDRCTTCHQAIGRGLPSDPDVPAFLTQRAVRLTMAAPAARPELAQGEDAEDLMRKVYGFRLVGPGALNGSPTEGLVNKQDVTVTFVRPESLAAQAAALKMGDLSLESDGLALREAAAMEGTHPLPTPANGLQVGDVIEYINGNKVLDRSEVRRFLLETHEWGQPLTFKVRRGLPHPYASHPRLDLFVGPNSPHPLQTFGCTSCHEGQGSATAFKWASHFPNDTDQRQRWSEERGWFNNHHWIFPMHARRFAESSCLRCHHEVTDLGPSERFPQAPAPKVTAGHDLVRQYGCFGCHEVNGFDGPDRRIGPDLRLEPNFFAAAQQLGYLLDQEIGPRPPSGGNSAALAELLSARELAGQVATDPEGTTRARHQLLEQITADRQRPDDERVLPAAVAQLQGVLKDVESPGTQRKVGPSLRFVKSKLDAAFLYDWIRDPAHFRPTTKMPSFFGQYDHLHGEDLLLAQQFEPIEVQGIVAYLLQRSQPYLPVAPPTGITPSSPDERVARGKQLFEFRGCLACHQHADFPSVHAGHEDSLQGHSTHGPDLTNIGDKLSATRNSQGAKWLYSWLREPSNYHVRTKMPNLYLEPITHTDDDGNVTSVTDPAADIAAYLLNSSQSWQPGEEASSAPDPVILDRLVMEHLGGVFFSTDAERYLEEGIPASMAGSLKGAETELVEPISGQKKLLYVGRQTITKYGCYACHDIPGFEDAKPIGTGLAGWGRKDPSKLDFGHIVHYLQHGEDGHGDNGHGDDGYGDDGYGDDADNSHESHAIPVLDQEGPIEPYFLRSIMEHGREGFAMQKLREPRSYDVEKTANIGFNERLRMPKFPLNDAQREAIITLLVGLVAEPPVSDFVFQPSPRRAAIIAGEQVIAKYNCTGCHMLDVEQWELAFEPGAIRAPADFKQFPFLNPHFSAAQLKESSAADRRGELHATLVGLPKLSDDDAWPMVWDDEGDPVEQGEPYDPESVQYLFDVWDPVLLDGETYRVGGPPLVVPASAIRKKIPSRGGLLTRYLLPRVLAMERETEPAAKGGDAWSWLPPPLVGQGNKVQADWLHGFLLDPIPIRPAVVMRMPRFNMSADEATSLVNYFAARDDSTYPYEFNNRTRSTHLADADAAYDAQLQQLAAPDGPQEGIRLEHAMQIVVNNNYCIKCHIVGDFQPSGSDRAKAPDLSVVYRRLRPDYVRRWVANPKSILPYTSMPVNIPFDTDLPHLGGVGQEIFHGSSIEQLDGLIDLLMNFDQYNQSHSKIAPLVQATPAEAADAGEVEAAVAESPDADPSG